MLDIIKKRGNFITAFSLWEVSMASKENRVKYETLKKNWKEEMDMKTCSMGMECDVTV